MSTSKKRPAGEDGFVPDDDNMEVVQARKRAVASSPHSDKKQLQNDQFLDDKKSLWQQGMEQLNERTKKTFEELDHHEDITFACMEYIRQRDWIHQRYNPSCGQVVAMGSDDTFQLGIAASSDADDKKCEYRPTIVGSVGQKVAHVAGGGLHSLALTKAGTVFSTGCNDDNALGRGKVKDDQMHLVEPITIGFHKEDRNRIVAIDAGDSHSLFLSIKGNVYQCGMYKDVDSGKFRDVPIDTSESPKGSNEFPTLVDLPGAVRDIEAGEAFNASIMENGEVYTWGMGHFGQLARSKNMGAELKKDEKSGHPIPGVYDLGKMWIGEEYKTGEIERDHDGKNMFDKEGNPIMEKAYRYHLDLIRDQFLKPGLVCWEVPHPKRRALSVACGEIFMVIVARDDGYDTKVYSAGHNGYGQLGHGDDLERHELTSIKDLEGKLIKKVVAGSSHALALDMGGNGVFAWGRSDYGQVGVSDDVRGGDIEKSPKQVAFPQSLEGTRIRDIVAGPSVSMAITEENDVYTWGFCESCATGHSSDKDITRPKKLHVLRKANGPTNCHVLEAAGGAQHSLMIVQRFAGN